MPVQWKCLDCGSLMDGYTYQLHDASHTVKLVAVGVVHCVKCGVPLSKLYFSLGGRGPFCKMCFDWFRGRKQEAAQ